MINKDNLIEFKSKYYYSFNTTPTTKDLIIGIHQNQFLYRDFSNVTYVGFVVLSKSGWDYKYKDHIYLNENYSSYLHLKLDIGTYMIVPM